MDRTNILLAAAVIVVAACATYIIMEDDSGNGGGFGDNAAFIIHIDSDGGIPASKDMSMSFSEVGDGKVYWFYDFTDIMSPAYKAPARLWPEDTDYGFVKIKVMAGTGKMTYVDDGWYQWDKDQQQYRKVDGKEVYYEDDDGSLINFVVFPDQTLSVRIGWTTDVIGVTFYSNNSDMLTKEKCYANTGEMPSGYLPGADFFTSDSMVIKGWGDDQHTSIEDSWKPGEEYYGHCGTSIFAIWGPA